VGCHRGLRGREGNEVLRGNSLHTAANAQDDHGRGAHTRRGRRGRGGGATMTPAVYGIMFFTLGAAIVFASWVTARHLSASRQAKAAIATNGDFQGLADEYRRLSDMAIAAQEHTDLRLTDISVRIDQLRAQMEQLQRILKEVE